MENIVKNVKRTWYVPYHWWYGKGLTFFFEKMKEEKKIHGARCTRCEKVVVPVTAYCARCFAPTSEDWIELSDTAIINSFTIVNLPYPGQPATPPYAYAMLRFEGADNLFMHLIGGIELEKIRIGMKVKAVWREERTGGFHDIEYFKPVEES